MCETHWEMRKERDERSRTGGGEQGYNNNNRREPRNTRPRRYGGGPREDSEEICATRDRQEWTSQRTNNTFREDESFAA